MQPAQSIWAPDTLRCLIIEDSEFDRERMRRVLARSHHTFATTCVVTLAEAREHLANTPPDLILLDNNLPDGLGTNFATELADEPDLQHIPVILISDWPSPFMWDKAALAGVRFVLGKQEFDARFVNAVLDKTKGGRQRSDASFAMPSFHRASSTHQKKGPARGGAKVSVCGCSFGVGRTQTPAV